MKLKQIIKSILLWVLSLIIGITLSIYFDGKFFIIRCILVIPFTYLAVKETFKIFIFCASINENLAPVNIG